MGSSASLDYTEINWSGIKSISVGLAMCGCLFKDIHVMKLETFIMLTNDPLKLNNAINNSFINLNIISYYSFSLNIYEYHQHQLFHNQPKN